MSYQVLARKWRPQTFADVVGQEHVLTAIANGLKLGRLHHAYLFSGTRGVGKTTIARLFAKGLNCVTGITATPCGRCDNCQQIEQGRFVDLIEIDAASRTKVEDTRELLDNVQYAPAQGRFKVYLIDEVHMLSRHSFNALLKTLEEPPAHVKFLLATTDPQKLPITILSRCLQFHLKAMDLELIRQQLESILQAEQISSDNRALQLLARAADGSMRDALSLTDQAIALGQGQISSEIVSQMLGTLDDQQPLAILEALVNANGESVMSQLTQAAARAVDWENLLVEMLTLLHRIAMIQLLPSALDSLYAPVEQRLRELARTMPPEDVQLYYQILLMGRKELPLAPDRRMGIEMTLLRALAFHPKAVIAAPNSPTAANGVLPQSSSPLSASAAAPAPPGSNQNTAVTQPIPAVQPTSASTGNTHLSETTAQLLKARSQLLRQQGNNSTKKDEPAAPAKARPGNSTLERLASVVERIQPRSTEQAIDPSSNNPSSIKQDAYRWRAQNEPSSNTAPVTTPKALRAALEHEKTSAELQAKLVAEAIERDSWASDIAQLTLPKLVEQLALNSFRQQVSASEICLHLRTAQRHLNTTSAHNHLSAALSQLLAQPVELTIVADDNPATRTPLEWRQAIYEEKLAQARQSIVADPHIQMLCQLFDADLDQESIRPV
ncbi:DNA polymerase III subunit gamma/tau [Serratia microhaemolytica]|uniref:DNA polymerase III subunit gamma/tau n=1 Tax=Serratia microhaemolytica TaxID=2675110 RepID=UPI000FDD81A6|nr:DNA polymerase III subunit gamma/tau [Serratia microhaemolytica]